MCAPAAMRGTAHTKSDTFVRQFANGNVAKPHPDQGWLFASGDVWGRGEMVVRVASGWLDCALVAVCIYVLYT